MLLEAHTRLTRLASTMDVNDFSHVNCTYLPRSSRSGSQAEIVPHDTPLPSTAAPAQRPRPATLMPPPSTASIEAAPLAPPSPLPSTQADFDVSHSLSERSPIIGSDLDEPFDQYGSQLLRREEDSPVSEENLLSPGRHRSSPLRPSPRVSPPHLSSTRSSVPPQYEDVDLLSQPEVASSTAQVIDTEPPASPTRPASDVAGRIQENPAVEEIAVVAPSTVEVAVINYSDIDSCDSKRLLGDSTDEDSDGDDVGVDKGVQLPAAPTPGLNVVDPALAPPTTSVVGSLPPASTVAASSSIPAMDEFYNAAGKAPHPESIVPKQESGWWANREMRKRKKAEERANTARELQRIQEEAARLAEQNATLQRELNLARQSNSGATAPALPSTSAASIGGPKVHEVRRGDSCRSTPASQVVASAPIALAVATRSLRACGTEPSAGRGLIYPRPEDNPTPSESLLQTPEDSLRFQIEEEMDATNPTEGVQRMSLDDAGDLIVDVGDEEEEDEEQIEEEGDSDDEEEEEEEEDTDDRLDYGSSPDEEDTLAAGTQSDANPRRRLRFEVHLVKYDDTGSDKVILISRHFLSCSVFCYFLHFLEHPCRFIICSF